MAITDESRHELYKRLEEMMGRTHATTLMEHLPPVGWADVATRQDLEHLRVATRQDLAQLREVMDVRFETIVTRGELQKHTMAMAGLMVALFGLFPLLYRLT